MNGSVWLGATIGALVSAVINGWFNWKIKREELHVQRLGVTMKGAELKHQQIVVVQDWAILAEGRPRNVDNWDRKREGRTDRSGESAGLAVASWLRSVGLQAARQNKRTNR